jgi:integrase
MMGKHATEFPQGVYVHKDRIVMRFQWNGKRVKQSLPDKVTQRNIERAGQIRREIVSRIRFGNFTQDDFFVYFPHRLTKEVMTDLRFFGSYAQSWLDSIEVSVNTRNEYRKTLNRYWMPRYAARSISSISSSELRSDVSNIDWASNKTRNNALIPLRRIFAMALDDGIIQRDPAAKLRNLKHQKPPIDPFTRGEAEQILATLYQRYEGAESIYAAYFEFAFFSGMRPSEMLALRWSDVDEHRDYVRVSKAQSKGRLNDCTKNSTIRDVLLNERTLHALEVARSISYHADSHVFKSPRLGIEFKTEKSPRDVFTDQLKQLEIRHRPAYNTRHTYATMLLMAGVNLHFVANQLGHSPIMTATVYSKWINSEADHKELAKLDTRAEDFLTGKEAVQDGVALASTPELAPRET